MDDDDNEDSKQEETPPPPPKEGGGGEEEEADERPRLQHVGRRGSVLRRMDDRRDHMKTLVLRERMRSQLFLSAANLGGLVSDTATSTIDEESSVGDSELIEMKKGIAAGESMNVMSTKLQQLQSSLEGYGIKLSSDTIRKHPLEVRVKDFSFSAEVDEASELIPTVYNSSMLYPIVEFFKHLAKGEKYCRKVKTRKSILDNINLIFEPGKSYLLLGPPASGKTTLLKSIAGLLRPTSDDDCEGTISYNSRTLENEGEFYIENAFAYIDQLDKHAPRLTVEETFEFAYSCKAPESPLKDPPKGGDSPKIAIGFILTALGLAGVKDTYVGDTSVRGVSGGQRRRVTVGEMLTAHACVMCGDEISTGLDAASTYDMIQVILYFAKFAQLTRIFSLLQPSPETVSLFDEVILLAEGQIIYSGPVKGVEDYFADCGYVCPRYMDCADFLQMVSTEDGSTLYKGSGTSPTVSELAKIFSESDIGKGNLERLDSPFDYVWKKSDEVSQHNASQVSSLATEKSVSRKYANNFFVSTWLIFKRFILLWTRDKRVIAAGAVKNVIMGLSVGGCYLSTTNTISIEGSLFQAGLFIILGAMQTASALISDRVIFYKQTDANFYSAWPFCFGRVMSQLPQVTADTITFATILYFMVGLAGREDAVNFFVYLSLLWVFAILMGQQLAAFASFVGSGALSAISSCLVLLLILFCGFIISPSTIPGYYVWLYWWNPFAWIYRALVVNEFRSGRWPNPDEILTNSGFVDPYGNPYGQEWVGYAYAFAMPYSLLMTVLTALGLTFIRNEGSTGSGDFSTSDSSTSSTETEEGKPEKAIVIPFKPVTLSFQDICYAVTASTSKETLSLLKNISGIFRPGRMCALMGSSGAGKTTLLDVIALRKRTGTISGKVLLNGFPQDKVSFRRCSGYVEQFDVQSPELTVRETILFSAKLRLDPKLVTTDGEIQAFVDQIMDDVELSILRDSPVGTDEGGGLSFEQKKRLSIAVELAASPSIIFLDEPTSGLDARSAMLVVKTLRKIADGGRTICATIHQPSSSVFAKFDDLLLLKKGGQVVFHGDLGDENSSHLVAYFETKGAEPIELGDNPANWMLRVLDSGGMGDLAQLYLQSEEYSSLQKELEEIENTRDDDMEIKYDKEFATSRWTRQKEINHRLETIYWRSPSYNYSRLLVSMVVSFVLGSSFITNRHPDEFTENDMRSRVSVIFLSFIITGIMAILSVLPVMTWIRDMFYRQRDAGMYDSASIGLALGTAEKWFIIFSTFLFTTLFLATAGLLPYYESPAKTFFRSVAFWGFFTFSFALSSYFGQLFVCLVKPAATAAILASVYIGLNNFFSGLVVRPQFMIGTFYVLPYYITPGSYVYNGLITALYSENNSTVIADQGSEFYYYLVNSTTNECDGSSSVCDGTASEYVYNFFGGQFGLRENNLRNALVLGLYLVVARLFTYLALKYIRFSD